jgi:hypothetical protein
MHQGSSNGGAGIGRRADHLQASVPIARRRRSALRVIKRRSVRISARVVAFSMVASLLIPLALQAPAQAQPGSCPAAGCAVTIDAREYSSGNPAGNALDDFTYLINVDNSRFVDPATRQPVDPFPQYLTTESNSPVVAVGDKAHPVKNLPDGRYLVSVRSPGHKMWGAYITLPDDATSNAATVRIDLTRTDEDHPLPLGKIRVFVFEDNTWANGAPDTEETGLGGFQVGLVEQTGGEVTVDYNNNPLCGGVCLSEPSGFAQIDDLGPATYFIDVHPPEGPCNDDPNSAWYQTTTIDGGLSLQAGVEEGSDGTGAPGEQLWEPPTLRTAYWFGFVCSPTPFDDAGTGEITGTARNWQGWPPFDVLTLGEPVQNPFVALSDTTTQQTVFIDQGDAEGNFDIQNVPAGTYNLSIWDEQLTYIMRFTTVTVGSGDTVDVNETDLNGEVGIGVSRWYGWLDGYVYKDRNGNQVMDPGEPGIGNTDVDQRWRDGSIKEGSITDPSGYYEYPTAEGGPLGKWIIGEQGFGNFGVTGASVHDEFDPSIVTPVPTAQGGALLTNQLLIEGHRATVDWGKCDYPPAPAGSTPCETAPQIVGVTYWAITRNEFNARLQAHEDYEPGVPDVSVLLEGVGPDNEPNTIDDVVLNEYVTDHWQHPNASQDPLDPVGYPGWSQGCSLRGFDGSDISGQVNAAAGPNCIETPLTGEQTKDGAFDGGYAFADYCPESIGGYDLEAGECADGSLPDDHPLAAGTYVVHSVMPKDPDDTRDCNPTGFKYISDPKGSVPGGGQGCLYRIVREEDVNVDLGNHFAPQLPPPPCVGDDHVIDQATLTTRSFHYGVAGAHAPLCDKRLVQLQNGMNFNADFNMMTNFRNDPNGENPADTWSGDVQEPGRIIGLVSNDIYFERDPLSVWYGEPRPIGGIPIGIYQRVDTVDVGSGGNLNPPYDADNWRLFTTIWTTPEGTYEALLPSTETWNCPIPQGPCPGMYLVTVNDPGTVDAPNDGYDPNLLTATTAWDVWPGLTDQLDTPLDPISGTGCEDPAVEPRPELLQVSRPYVNAGDSGNGRRITIQADFIGTRGPTGATGGRVTLTDHTGNVTTLTRANGGVVTWNGGTDTPAGTSDTIVIQVPPASVAFPPGPKQLDIITSNANGGVSSVNGITLHVLGAVPSSRTDNATTFNGRLVIDPLISAGDVGRTVLGTGIPSGTTISSAVSSGTLGNRRFTMSNAATQTGFRTLTIRKVDSPVSWTNSSNNTIDHTVNDPSVVAADDGRSVTLSGNGINGSRIIQTVNPGVSFTISGNGVTASDSGETATITKIDPIVPFINDGTFVIDGAATSADVGSTVTGPGISASTTITALASYAGIGSGFVMNNVATATSYPGTVSLTITSPVSVPPYNPTLVNVPPPPPVGSNPHALQDAIDSATPGSLLVLSPGVYNENVLVWKPLKIQGVGAGGIIGAHELQARDPEDARFHIVGSVIDGRFFSQNAAAYDATVAAHAPFALASEPLDVVLRGADITVVAQSTGAYGPPGGPADALANTTARLDGMGLMTGRGDGAGGIQLQANANNLQITNNVLENNGGVVAGGIGLGQPFAHDSHNYNVRVANDRLIGNGGLTQAGAIGVFYGSNNYEIARSIICANFSVNYGAGVGHIGLSPGGSIHDNQIFYNESVDSAGGIAIESEIPTGNTCADAPSVATCLGDGSGAVNLDRNLIQSNFSGDDGGGLYVLDALGQPINVRNNMIVDNGAADIGGAIALANSADVRIINNSIANNVSTSTAEDSDGLPHSAGLAAEANHPLWQAAQSGSAPDFSNPTALFNNIFWQNTAFTLSQPGPGATLVSEGVIDLEVHATGVFADRFTPRYSLITANSIIAGDGSTRTLPGGNGNIFGDNPDFVTPFILELTVMGSRLDPQTAMVTITGADPPVGLTGDYHILTTSPAVDQGAGFSNLATPAPLGQTPNASAILAPCSGTLAQSYPGDYDRQFRPQLRVNARVRTPWDLGADELAGTGTPAPRTLAIPGSYTQGPDANFNWNGSGQLQCSTSTETR